MICRIGPILSWLSRPTIVDVGPVQRGLFASVASGSIISDPGMTVPVRGLEEVGAWACSSLDGSK